MMHIDIDSASSVMSVRLEARLRAQDFELEATPAADWLCQEDGRIELLLIEVSRFDGWAGEACFAAQIAFLKRFHRDIRRVALLGGPAWRGALPAAAGLFVSSDIRHFCHGDTQGLIEWLGNPLRWPNPL